MEEKVCKLMELTGTSKQSLEGAITNAIAKAARTVCNMCWFQLIEARSGLENGEGTVWQVTMKIGFELDK